MTEWLSKEKEKKSKKEISTGEEAGGGLHFLEFLGFLFRQLLAWESNYMAAAAEDRGVFFFSFDTIETGSVKRKRRN